MKTLTIFTPTFNRANYLPRVYESLMRQTNKDFVWLIIDDGSEDNTSELVKSWIADNKIEIQYFYQHNQGKHIAFNRAIRETNTELFIDLDSDDYLLDNAVERLTHLWDEIPEKDKFSGVMALCQYSSGEIIGQTYPTNKFISNTFDLRYNHSIWGDKAMLYYTKVLKNYSLPELSKQYVMESILHNRIAQKYKSMCINEPLIVKEYLAEGISEGLGKKQIKNLEAFIILYNEMNYFNLSFSQYLHVNSRYVKYSLLFKSKSIYKNAINKNLLFPVSYFIGFLKYLRA